MTKCDVAIIGGGIVGLATARALGLQRPDLDVVVLEKEAGIARHQTGNNSGVIHAGLYYEPGSLKAEMCVTGGARLIEYCDRRGIRFEQCGKVVVATEDSELPALAELERRAAANGVPTTRLDAAGIAQHEPHAAGIAALHVPSTAIVDFAEVAASYRSEATDHWVDVRTGFEVVAAVETATGWRLESPAGWVEAQTVVNCAGLHVDRIAEMMGTDAGVSIVPFRGEYFSLKIERTELVRSLIYPVPDPRFPFLGVHFTRNIHGEVEIGPNAVLALAREGYTRTKISGRDVWDIASTRGFRKLAAANWRTGAGEMWRSVAPKAFVANASRLVPELEEADLADRRAGVRAQALTPEGGLVHDFVIEESAKAIHVLNAPSPAATASMVIGEHLAGLVTARQPT